MRKIVLVMVAIAFILSGCSIEQEKKQTRTSKEEIGYEYPDEYFNDTFWQKETGNKYFRNGKHLYILNKKDEVIHKMDTVVDNKYLIANANMVYHEGYIYILIFNINQNDVPLFGLARMKDGGSDFEYLFHIEEDVREYSGMGVHNDKIEIGCTQDDGNEACLSYSINENFKKEIRDLNPYSLRKEYIKNKYPSLQDEKMYKIHMVNNDIYFINRAGNMQKYNIKTNAIEEYNIEKYIADYGETSLSLIDGYWYFQSSKGVFKVSLDFSEEKQLLPSEEGYYITTNEQGQISVKEN